MVWCIAGLAGSGAVAASTSTPSLIGCCSPARSAGWIDGARTVSGEEGTDAGLTSVRTYGWNLNCILARVVAT
jgi:hypothetical protein